MSIIDAQDLDHAIDEADPERHFDARQKLDWLLDLDLAEHITWPPPSWQAIKSGRVYGR